MVLLCVFFRYSSLNVLHEIRISLRKRFDIFTRQWSLLLKQRFHIKLPPIEQICLLSRDFQLALQFWSALILFTQDNLSELQKDFGSSSLSPPNSTLFINTSYLIFGGLLFQRKLIIFFSFWKKVSSGIGKTVNRKTSLEIPKDFSIFILHNKDKPRLCQLLRIDSILFSWGRKFNVEMCSGFVVNVAPRAVTAIPDKMWYLSILEIRF